MTNNKELTTTQKPQISTSSYGGNKSLQLGNIEEI